MRHDILARIGRLGLWLLAACGPVVIAAPAPDCNRACLEGLVGRYVAALIKHDPSAAPLSTDFKASENGRNQPPGQGSWQTLSGVKSQPQFVADVPAQEIGYLGVVDDGGRLAFLALRLKIRQGQITEAESILSHDGEAGPAFEPEGFIYREAPYIRTVPLPVRSPRAELLKVANTYWDISTSTHAGQSIPYSVDCWHFENGMNTDWERALQPAELARADAPENQPQPEDGRIWTCAREAILSTVAWSAARDRQFLVDEERGLVFNIVYVDVAGRGLLGGPGRNPPPPPEPIEGPGRMPLGMSPAGMRAVMTGAPYTMAHFEVMRIVGGKITREQDVMHLLPAGATRPH